jgi:hypothetical protein
VVWSTVEYRWVPWSTVEYHWVPWSTVEYRWVPGVLWSTAGYPGVLWSTAGYQEYCGVPLGTRSTYSTASWRHTELAWAHPPRPCRSEPFPPRGPPRPAIACLHAVRCTLSVARCMLHPARNPLHVIRCTSSVACHTLSVARCMLDCGVLQIARCVLRSARCMAAVCHTLHTECRTVHVAWCHACCTLHIAPRMPQVVCCMLHAASPSSGPAVAEKPARVCCATPIVGRSSRRGVLSLERAAHARTYERAGATSAHVRCIAECSTQKCTIAPMRSEADMCVRNHYLADARTHGHTHICARTHACTHARPHARAHACTHARTWRTTRTQRLLLGSCGVQTLHAAAQGMREEVRAEVTRVPCEHLVSLPRQVARDRL